MSYFPNLEPWVPTPSLYLNQPLTTVMGLDWGEIPVPPLPAYFCTAPGFCEGVGRTGVKSLIPHPFRLFLKPPLTVVKRLDWGEIPSPPPLHPISESTPGFCEGVGLG